MIYLFAAYFVIWALTLAYAFSLSARAKRIERGIQLLLEREPAEPGSGPGQGQQF